MKETFEQHGCTWEVIRRYQLTDEYMAEHDLVYKNRITVRCIKSNGVTPVGTIEDRAER